MVDPTASDKPKTGTIDFSDLRSVINDKYYPYLAGNKRYELYMGGAGSGKSVFVTQKLCIKMMMEAGHKILGIRKVGGTCENSMFAEFGATIERWGLGALWKKRQSQASLDWTYIPNGSTIIFKGLDDQEKIKSISGITLIWVEEATEITPNDLRQLSLRLRPPKPFVPQIILSFNPINIAHWLNARFFKGGQKGKTSRLVTTFRDNKFLNAEYIQTIEDYNDPESASYDPYYYQVYGMGEWGVMGDLIYPFNIKIEDEWPWQVVENRTVVDPEELVGGVKAKTLGLKGDPTTKEIPFMPDDVVGGLDFGFNAPTTLHKYLIYLDRIYVVEHIYQRKMTTSDLIARLKEIKWPKNRIIYADNADPGAIEELTRAGFLVLPADKESGSVGAGIRFIKGLRIISNSENINFNMEASSYSWQQDKDGNAIDVPVKKYDHAMDNMRYALYTHLRGRIEDTEESTIEDLEDDYDEFVGFDDDLLT